ncbi:uncharacterized protein Z519_05327 [Cladophialophora bantiana CBS 173.52]|uniref:C2H2-type domain-containing protein n=1 Tax=Cladophialophora bantiana (strain ATCC 10958 / CBS 173.52 / CDC B-1940 / NIH 8579) TaxID=1442370 RepID=A0A0D2EW35_CLAB1|nr:uncharacterized protein Z519_05327 [Cladophialophora bantiana CBS 173.52]KIW94011.1 hypothetical protein Z519_05327 [Cladophialophora bantiana CBS 173.52]
MNTSTDQPSIPTSSAAGPDEADRSVTEISRPATVTELVGDARCFPCRRQGSRCHVEQGSRSCLQCSVADGCIFERLIVKQGHLLDFVWSDLIGQTSTIKKQPSSTALPAKDFLVEPNFTVQQGKERLSTPALPNIHEILPRPLSHSGTVVRAMLPWARLDGAFAHARRRGSFTDSAISNSSNLPQSHVETMAGDQTENAARATSLEAGATGATSEIPARATAESAVTARRFSSRSRDLDCSECDFVAKTRSDLKKHLARHKREHKCMFSECPQSTRGFATRNDLDRHLKSVHKINNRKARVYRCFAKDCNKAGKEWPRLDNFKQHLQKVHAVEETSSLVQLSNDWYEDQFGQQEEHDAQAVPKEVELSTSPLPNPPTYRLVSIEEGDWRDRLSTTFFSGATRAG